MRRIAWSSMVVIGVVVLSACGGGGAPSSSAGTSGAPPGTSNPPSTAPAVTPPAGSATATPVAPTATASSAPAACVTELASAPTASPAEPAQLADARVAVHDGVDRIVFEFAGDAVPEFDIAPAQPPFVQDGSGLPVDVPGAAFLHIHLPFATGMSTYQGPGAFAGAGGAAGTLVSLVRTGDFEAVMNWIAGTRVPACVRVSTLAAPTRIVLDVSPAG